MRAPLVGRAHELSLLEDALSDTLESQRVHTLTLVGAPGIGKSRLCREFLADVRARHEAVRVLTGQCKADGDPLGFLRTVLRGRFGLSESRSAPESARILEAAVREVVPSGDVCEIVACLASVLEIALPPSGLAIALQHEPQELRRVRQAILVGFLQADAARRPLILAIEDFHLAQPDAYALVHAFAQMRADVPLLVIVVARPALCLEHPDWLELGGDAVRFELLPLEPDDVADILEHMLGTAGELPVELVDEAVGLAAGNPYLLEQIVRSFVDQRALVQAAGGGFKVDALRLSQVDLPLSVGDVIAGRVAALSLGERRLMEMAAAIGGVFWLGALVSLERAGGATPELWTSVREDRARIGAVLDSLIDRDYVLRLPDSSIPGELEYAFKHNLERQALERATLGRDLERHHRTLAQWLELRITDSTEEQHELLCHHYERGGVIGRAAQHGLLAAERARKRRAFERAAEHYQHAIGLLGEGEGMLRVNSLERLGECLEHSGNCDRALVAYDDMRVLAHQLDLVPQGGSAHAHLGRVLRKLGDLSRAAGHFDSAQALFEHVGDHVSGAHVLRELAALHLLHGRYSAAEHLLRDAAATFEHCADARALGRTRSELAAALRALGQLPAARDLHQQAVGLLRGEQDHAGLARALTLLGVVHDRLGDGAQALALWNEALALAQQHDARAELVLTLTCSGAAAYRAGAHAEALAALTRAAQLAEAIGDRMQEADTLRSLAKARARLGHTAAAERDLQAALIVFERAQSAPQLAVTLRTQGELAAVQEAEGLASQPAAASFFERASAGFASLGDACELARSLGAHADHLDACATRAAGTPTLAPEAHALRTRARELLDQAEGSTIRAHRATQSRT